MGWASRVVRNATSIRVPTPNLAGINSIASHIRPQDALNNLSPDLSGIEAWARERGRVFDRYRLERWAVIKRWLEENADILMEPPDASAYMEVNPGGFEANPVFYVNGINTTATEAQDEHAALLSWRLRRPVRLLYNPTSNDLGVDLAECFYDKHWMPPAPQFNRTTKQLAWLMYHANGRFALVTHSQGCLIAVNALWTLHWLEKDHWIRENLAWFACGSPAWVPPCMPASYQVHTKPNDAVGQVIGMKGGKEWYKINLTQHSFVNLNRRNDRDGTPDSDAKPGDYLEWVEFIVADDRPYHWSASSPPPAASTQINYGRVVEMANTTAEPITVSVAGECYDPATTSWVWRSEERYISNGQTDVLMSGIPMRRIRYRGASADGTSPTDSWDKWEPPTEIADEGGYLAAGDVETTRLVLESQSSSQVTGFNAFGIHQDASVVRRIWYGFPARLTFRHGPDGGIDVYTRSNAWFGFDAHESDTAGLGPSTGNVSPYESCFDAVPVDSEQERVWFVPKSGNGPVWFWDSRTGKWFFDGSISRYVRPENAPDWEGDNDLDNFLAGDATPHRASIAKLECLDQQNQIFPDKIQIRLRVDGGQPFALSRKMTTGATWNVDHKVEFFGELCIELWDNDPLTPDFLGKAVVNNQTLVEEVMFQEYPSTCYRMTLTYG